MSQALYRKYRSRNLDEVLGQDHVTSILRRALEKGRVAHAYLLTGPRGTGKTSVARILAHEINQLPYTDDANHLDIIEIDAASNNGVDDIRSLREKARIAPVLAKRKIYIIDEVHMLSKPAFNALLKTLEEPPEHIVFILATTDADKLPSTILSRVQQYYFRPITVPIMTKQLMNIAQQEGFLLDESAARLIARRSRGGFRDSISLLDQLSSLASENQALSEEQVASSLGLIAEDSIDLLINCYETNDAPRILQTLKALEEQGSDPLTITQQLLTTIRGNLAEKPHFTKLIAQLIEVTKHPHPDLKLLTALLENSYHQEIANPIPSKKSAAQKPQQATKKPVEITKKAEKIIKKIEETTPKPKNVKRFDGEFDWQKILDEAKQRSMGLFSLLSKCGYDYADGELTLYAGNSFAKKKLDDAKNRPIIAEAAQKSQGGDIEIVIKSGKKPPQNGKIAAVAAMMGGGEEVSLEEIS